MSAILARAEDDLAWLCARCGVETKAAQRADAMRAALVEHLWDGERFRYHDAHADEVIESDVVGCYMPLWCGVDDAIANKLRARLAERYAPTWPLPSTSPADPSFDARRYWRGPTWVNINWMLSQSLGDDGKALADKTVAMVRDNGFREYFNPDTGEGLGAEQFTWSAALVLDLIERS